MIRDSVRSLTLVLLLVCAAPCDWVPGLVAQTPPDAAAVARLVQRRYATLRDFTGDFVQTYEGGVLRTKAVERGTVAIKRPGRMRWTYTRPERKEFVSDGVRLYTHLVIDKQVIVSPAPLASDGSTPALFLSGQADLSRDFVPSFTELPGTAAGLTMLKLVPKTPDPDFEWLAVGVDPGTFQIQHLVAADRQGGRSAFAFANLKENRGLTDKDFEFHIPRGVDVVMNGTRAR